MTMQTVRMSTLFAVTFSRRFVPGLATALLLIGALFLFIEPARAQTPKLRSETPASIYHAPGGDQKMASFIELPLVTTP